MTQDRVIVGLDVSKERLDVHVRGGERFSVGRDASGLKILFALLCCPRLVDRPYREISKASNAALGSVQLVITELINSNYVEVQGSSRRLHRSRELFERWVEAYGMTLYPQLRLGQYEADELAPWLEGRLPIRDFDAQWGGEVAAKQIVGYIRPSTVTVYAPGTPARLLAKMRARRSDEGAIQIRRRFWGDLEDSDSATVPAPLVYADLVASGDPRQIETARRMRGGMAHLDLSTRTDLPVPDEMLREMLSRADQCGVQLLVVGAAARDLLISGVTRSAPARATSDVDLAVAVQSWADVDCLTAGLKQARGGAHTFTVLDVDVDVIPFGAIEHADRTIMWANDQAMNVLGFQEALAEAVPVTLPGGGDVLVASLSAQAVLKLFAWQDRHHAVDDRDAIDLRAILGASSQGPYLDELYETEDQLLQRYDFDPLLAGAARAGREAARCMSGEALTAAIDIIRQQTGDVGTLPARMGGDIGLNRSLLRALVDGLTEAADESARAS